jgi:hypothetical protein
MIFQVRHLHESELISFIWKEKLYIYIYTTLKHAYIHILHSCIVQKEQEANKNVRGWVEWVNHPPRHRNSPKKTVAPLWKTHGTTFGVDFINCLPLCWGRDMSILKFFNIKSLLIPGWWWWCWLEVGGQRPILLLLSKAYTEKSINKHTHNTPIVKHSEKTIKYN